MQLNEEVVWIAGGASGLGAACARRLVQAGARVVLADIQAEAAQRLAEQLGGQAALGVACDVTSADSVRGALDAAQERFQSIRGVICCAGILGAARVLGRDGPHELELFSRVIQVNLIGTFNVLRLAAERLQHNATDAAGERGVFIATSSVAAFEGQIGQAAYAASKGGVASLILPAARELARFGIRVTAIAPGIFRTPMMDAAPEAVQQSLAAQTVFPPRLGDPDEFALFAQQILENPMLNGSVLRLDGGVRLPPK